MLPLPSTSGGPVAARNSVLSPTTPRAEEKDNIQPTRFLKMLIFLQKEDAVDACSGCATGDKWNTQQWAEELPGGHRGAARRESPASSHMNLGWLWNSCCKSKWQLEFPHFTALISALRSWREKAKQEKSTQGTSLITLRKWPRASHGK